MVSPGRRLEDGIFYGGIVVALGLLYLMARRDVGMIAGLKGLGLGFLSLGVLAVVAWVVRRLLSRPETPTARQLARRLEEVRRMDGTRFEAFVADVFLAMGHEVARCGGVGDQGVDLVLNPRGGRIAVQCKNHVRPVGNGSVQEVYAGARHHRCVEAWVVAPAGYTRGALELARSTHVSLHDAESLRFWIGRVDAIEKGRAGVTPVETGGSYPQPAFAGRKTVETVETVETAGGVASNPDQGYSSRS